MPTRDTLRGLALETNSPLFQVVEDGDDDILQLTGNTRIGHIRGGKVALFGESRRNYSVQAEMKFLGHHVPDMERAGWFGFVFRAQDFENFELVWFMPNAAEGRDTVAYVPVAHGVCPWWTEAYETQKKGNPELPQENWFRARVDVHRDEFSVYVNDAFVFKKKLTYFLEEGRPGVFLGTGTDAAFRRVVVKDLPERKVDPSA